MTESRGATAASREAAEAIDPDVDLHIGSQRAETAGHRIWHVLGAVAAGGAIGASARYAVSLTWPAPEGGFPRGACPVRAGGS